MLIPVRCVTCGRVLADKWRAFWQRVTEAEEQADPMPATSEDGLIGTQHARVLDDMGIHKICCRRHMLTNVDAMDRI